MEVPLADADVPAAQDPFAGAPSAGVASSIASSGADASEDVQMASGGSMCGAAAPSSSAAAALAVSALVDASATEVETQWRRRRRRQDDATTDDDTRSVVSSQWQPDAADVEMMTGLSIVEALPVGRIALESSKARGGRRVKRMKVDLASMSMGPPMAIGDGPAAGRRGSTTANAGDMGGMFSDINLLAPADEHTGNALLCFLTQETFVGFVELQAEGRRHVLKLNGSESLTECDRTLCNVQDCCGDKAFLVTAQSQSTHGKRKRTFLARSAGVGDYVAFEGRGMRFVTDFVPGDEQRDQVTPSPPSPPSPPCHCLPLPAPSRCRRCRRPSDRRSPRAARMRAGPLASLRHAAALGAPRLGPLPRPDDCALARARWLG